MAIGPSEQGPTHLTHQQSLIIRISGVVLGQKAKRACLGVCLGNPGLDVHQWTRPTDNRGTALV